MAKILFYQNGIKVAQTSQAVDCIITNELMRSYNLKFAVVNNNPARQFITPGAVFEVRGQLFDIASFYSESGTNNYTDVVARHVSYQLNDYIIPPEYSCFGTAAEVAQNILDTAKTPDGTAASSKFSLGTVRSTTPSLFTLGNEQEVSARSAFIAMQSMGVEVDYDNFTVNLPQRVGSDTGKVFEFGRDLVSVKRTWRKGDGSTYEVDIATLYKLPGGSPDDEYHKGDDVTIKDELLGETIKRRIICVQENPDDPTQDRIVLGVFVADNATNAINTKVQIDSKLTEGESYNNVRINRTEGFVSETDDQNTKVTMSGTGGFQCWAKQGGTYVPVAALSVNGLEANRITRPGSGIYGEIGTIGNNLGFALKDGDGKPFFGAYSSGYPGFFLVAEDDTVFIAHTYKTTLYFSNSTVFDATQYSTMVSYGQELSDTSISLQDDKIVFRVGGVPVSYINGGGDYIKY